MAINILIVEDSPTQLEWFQHILTTNAYIKRIGAQITVAQNGRVACDLVAQAQAAGQPISLILMDMHMPELDGYQAAAQLRRSGFSAPIIALTAQVTKEEREKCLAAGCTEHISKMFLGDVLFTTVIKHLTTLNSQASSHSSAGAAGLQSQCKDDPDMRHFIPAFVASLPEQVTRLMDLLDRGNVAELKKLIHNLKGTAGVYGFGSISESATQVEALTDCTAVAKDMAVQIQALVELIRHVDGYDAQKEKTAGSRKS